MSRRATESPLGRRALKKPERRLAFVLPLQREIRKGILRDAGLSIDEFRELL
jgi:hypothetical protein